METSQDSPFPQPSTPGPSCSPPLPAHQSHPCAKESDYVLIVSEPAKNHVRAGYDWEGGKGEWRFEIVCEMWCSEGIWQKSPELCAERLMIHGRRRDGEVELFVRDGEKENRQLRLQYENLGKIVGTLAAPPYVFPPSPRSASIAEAAANTGNASNAPQATERAPPPETKAQKQKRLKKARQARRRAKIAELEEPDCNGFVERGGETWYVLPNGWEVHGLLVTVKVSGWWDLVGKEERG